MSPQSLPQGAPSRYSSDVTASGTCLQSWVTAWLLVAVASCGGRLATDETFPSHTDADAPNETASSCDGSLLVGQYLWSLCDRGTTAPIDEGSCEAAVCREAAIAGACNGDRVGTVTALGTTVALSSSDDGHREEATFEREIDCSLEPPGAEASCAWTQCLLTNFEGFYVQRAAPGSTAKGGKIPLWRVMTRPWPGADSCMADAELQGEWRKITETCGEL